jgi:N-acetylglucosamine kinase-like BadF-type ATPase
VATSSLAKALCKAWGVLSLSDLARAANSVPTPNFAVLFRPVVASEDELAKQVLRHAGRELAEVATVVIRQLFSSDDAASVPVAMIGGVFRHAAAVREAFYNELRGLAPCAQVMPQVVDPVEGALRLARRGAGNRV